MSSDPSPARAIGRPREARADRAILTATLQLMAERGVRDLRMDDVADRAGVGKATIYRRYRSKNALVSDAIATLVSEIAIPDTGSTRADLLALMRQAVDLYSGSLAARLMPAVLEETRRNPELASTVRDEFLAGRRAALSVVLERGVRRGDLRPDLDLELALDVLGGALFYRLLVTGGPIDERLAEGVVELILAGFAPTRTRETKPPHPKGQTIMKIHALTTGTVSVKHGFLFPRHGARRQLDLFLPGAFSEPLPIHCWAIEHDGVLRLVDTGETAAARNVPFAQMHVSPDQELPAAMAAAGLELDDVSEVVLTHAHGDHIDGLVHVRSRVLVNEAELRFVASPMARVMRRVLRQPLPARFAPEPFALDGGPFGAFARSRALTDDGRIVAVDTPGHTPGHISVICVDDTGNHVMLAGDATDSLEQLYSLRADAVAPDSKVHVATMKTILAHCAQHPTVYLPSHDPESAARFAAQTTVNVDLAANRRDSAAALLTT